jgi:hypothetical protein
MENGKSVKVITGWGRLVVRKLYKAVEGGSVSGVVGSQEKNSLKG